MKKIIVLFLLITLLTGCMNKILYIKDFSPESEDDGIEGIPLESLEYSSIEQVPVLEINEKYYLKCRDEYKSTIERGYVVAKNNKVQIDIRVIRGTDKVKDLTFSAKAKDKKHLIDEINTMLSLNDYDKITREQFDKISLSTSEADMEVIGNLGYQKQEVGGKVYIGLSRKDSESR